MDPGFWTRRVGGISAALSPQPAPVPSPARPPLPTPTTPRPRLSPVRVANVPNAMAVPPKVGALDLRLGQSVRARHDAPASAEFSRRDPS